MTTPQLSTTPENTHQAVLFHLKRNREMSVADLCEALQITAMAVRRHLLGLQQEGLIESKLIKQQRGRPTYRYSLTEKGESRFPSAAGGFAFDILDAVHETRGAEGVTELLEIRDEYLVKKLKPEFEVLPLETKVEKVAKIFADNGYMTDWKALPDGKFFVWFEHCAIHNLAQHYQQLCMLEPRLMERLLGVKVTREKHMLNNDPICGYLIHPGEPAMPD